MDINNIETRIKIIYSSLNSQHTNELPKNVHVRELQTGGFIINFGSLNMTEKYEKVYSLVSHIGSLKDIINKNLGNKSFEEFINNSQSLCLIMDIYNKYKHGNDLKKWAIRSYVDPVITNLRQPLKLSSRSQGSSGSVLLGRDGNVAIDGNLETMVVLTGDITNDKGHKIMEMEKMFEDAVLDIENFCHANKLI